MIGLPTEGNTDIFPLVVNIPEDNGPVRETTQELEQAEIGSQQAQEFSTTPALDVDDTEDSEPVHETTQQLEQSEHGSQQAQKSSVTPAVPLHISLPSLLPDHIFTSSLGKCYDRDWMTKHGVDKRILAGFSSKTHFGSLVVHGAIKIGDRLRVTYDSDNGAIHKEGTVSLCTTHLLQRRFPLILLLQITKGVKNFRPDIIIPGSGTGGTFITVHGCAGPLDFINAMNGEFGEQYGYVSGGWKAVTLINGEGRDMGTLWTVRQTYHIWVEEKDKWAFRNNQPLAYHNNSTNPRPGTGVPKGRKPKEH